MRISDWSSDVCSSDLAGADVCIVDLNAAGLEETATQLRALDVRVRVHAADLSQRDSCPAAVTAAVSEFGRLDALCNIAGIIIMCNAHEMRAVDYEKTIAVNLNATRSEEHTSELQSLMRNSYAVFCLKKKN